MPDTIMKTMPNSEPAVRMNDFVKFLLNNMSDNEQNEAIKVIIDTIRKEREDRIAKIIIKLNALIDASNKLEDILKDNS